MPTGAKIATCCYCGSRTVLTLQGEGRHELGCSACGAPLHNMKSIKSEKVGSTDGAHRVHGSAKPAKPAKPHKVAKKDKKKKRKSFGARLFDEAFDALEDLFD